MLDVILFYCKYSIWYNDILFHSKTWIILCLQLYLLFWIFFSLYFILLICYSLSYFLLKKSDYAISLSLSLSRFLIFFSYNSTLGWWIFMFYNIFTFGWYILVFCFLSSPSQVLSLPFITLVWSFFLVNLSIVWKWEFEFISNIIYMATYLNVPIYYLSNINCNYVISFNYYDNLLKRMRNLNDKFKT